MMNNNAEFIAKRYARAYLKVKPDDITSKDVDNLKQSAHFFSRHKNQLYLVHLANAPDDSKLEALQIVLKKFHLGHLEKIVRLLLEQRRIYLLPQVLTYLWKLYFERASIIEFEVTSVVPLNEDARSIIEHFLAHKTGKKIRAHYALDDTLVAGICLKSDEYIWEFSVRQDLNLLKQAAFVA